LREEELLLELLASGEAARFLEVAFLARFLGAELASTRSASFIASFE
jgi:hypothetical protein